MFKTDVVYHPGAEIELDRIPADMTTGRVLFILLTRELLKKVQAMTNQIRNVCSTLDRSTPTIT